MAGRYAADGSNNVTVVSGSTRTGLVKADGSFNVVASANDTPIGVYHPSGALNVVTAPSATPVGIYAPDGSLYVTDDVDRLPDGAMRVTALSGALGAPEADVPTVTAAVLTGTPEVGHDVTVTPTTTGTGTITYSWNRGNGKITGEITSTYTLSQSDINKYISATVGKHNKTGGHSRESNSIFVISDVTAPTITSAATANNVENTVLAHALTASEPVTWSLVGGSDQARFELSGSTLRWLANGTKDFEAPNDSDVNNTYVVTVRATDVATLYTDQTITITVTDAVG